MTYSLNLNEKRLFSEIENTEYMRPILGRTIKFVKDQNNPQKAWKNCFDHIHTLLIESKDDVDKILAQRKARGEIKDISQARKTIAGGAFSRIIVYVFLQNKIIGNIRPEAFITSKKSQVKGFDKVSTIYVGEETQKPDCDLIIFSLDSKNEVKKYMILSLKTSLRERAGQTYKWKLLLEIATSDNRIKDKYDIFYPPNKAPLVCFATTNFYEEIDHPQQRGMFKFFDRSFIAKPLKRDFISPLSSLVDFVNSEL